MDFKMLQKQYLLLFEESAPAEELVVILKSLIEKSSGEEKARYQDMLDELEEKLK